MVFCVTMKHAQLVKELMQNLLGPATGKNQYAVRIVSEDPTVRSGRSSTRVVLS
jgi:type I restriction enzyme R subunit